MNKKGKDYIQNNCVYFQDIDIVVEIPLSDARNQCERKLNYEFDETDLNQDGGKFVHMCIKRDARKSRYFRHKSKRFPK